MWTLLFPVDGASADVPTLIVLLSFLIGLLDYFIFSLLKFGTAKNSVFHSRDSCGKLSRYSVDLILMLIFCFLGFFSVKEYGGYASWFEAPFLGKLYNKQPYTTFLCALQSAYEFKSFIDAFLHGDAWIFPVHHALAGSIAYFAATTGFSQCYGSFFLGISEISTTLTCILVLFDETRGIEGLSEKAPTIKLLSSVTFALLFVIFRIVLWPVVCYFFWVDAIHAWDQYAQSKVMVVFFLTANTLLSILQLIFLKDIILGALKLFAPDASSSSSSSSSEQNIKKNE